MDAAVRVPLAEIDGDETFMFRMRLQVKDLADDIAQNGQDFPVVVREVDGRLQLVCGFRRVTALRSLGEKEVWAVVRTLSDDEAWRLAWSENEARQDYSDLDRAHGIVKAKQAGKSGQELRELFGLEKSQLARLARLVELPRSVKKALEQGRIRTTHAVVLNRLRGRYPDMDVSFWVREIWEQRLSVRQLQVRVGLAHDPVVKPLVEVVDGGLKVGRRKVMFSKLDDGAKALLVEQLEAALAALRGSG